VEEEKFFKKTKEGNKLLISCISSQSFHNSRKITHHSKKILSLLYELKIMDIFHRFAYSITILVDSKAICLLRQYKD
jgi:hypothetical protein